MNKEFDKNNTGSIWLADKRTVNGEEYYNGTITIDNKDYPITMFKNNSDNPKAPKFRLKVNVPKEVNDYVIPKEKTDIDKAYVDFGDTIEITENDIEIAF